MCIQREKNMSYQLESRIRSQKLIALNGTLDKLKDDLTLDHNIDMQQPWLVHLMGSLRYELTKEILENEYQHESD